MTDYELTRRDAMAALGAAGVTVAGGTAALTWSQRDDDENPSLDEHDRETLHAVAFTVYPSEVTGVREFVDGYVTGRVEGDPGRTAGIAAAVTALDDYAEEWENGQFAALSPRTRDETLSAMGVDIADPDPDGEPRERVRHFLVNELLYALFSSPTGGELVGLENPQGHPGGTASYRRPPE